MYDSVIFTHPVYSCHVEGNETRGCHAQQSPTDYSVVNLTCFKCHGSDLWHCIAPCVPHQSSVFYPVWTFYPPIHPELDTLKPLSLHPSILVFVSHAASTLDMYIVLLSLLSLIISICKTVLACFGWTS